jgi:hypothetical protein
MEDEAERLKILEMIEQGQISAEDGIRLLRALAGELEEDTLPEAHTPPSLSEPPGEVTAAPPTATRAPQAEFEVNEADGPADQPADAYRHQAESPGAQPFQAEPEVIPPNEKFDPTKMKWRSFWWIPMLVGVGITLFAALLMFLAWNSGGFGFWFACTWFPFTLGVVVMALAWASRSARWLHVRVHQKPGETPQRIAISLPIPLRLTAWALRTFGKKIPHLGNTGVDELIMALDATSPDTPFYVEVNEGANGERVEVYIG